MASVIIMPKQGLMMKEGTLTNWLAKEGEQVVEGEPLFEMETDKLTITMDSTASGTLLKIIHQAGEVVPVTQPIAVVGEPGEDISSLLGDDAVSAEVAATAAPAEEEPLQPVAVQKSERERVFSSPRARMRAEENGMDVVNIAGSGPDAMVIERDVEAAVKNQPNITPLAANIARNQGVDISSINGTGTNGKIIAADISNDTTSAAPAALAENLVAIAEKSRGTRLTPMNGMRKAICNNMLNSKETNAQTNHHMDVDMTKAIELRKQLKALDVKVSYNDIIVRACAKALMDYPIANASVVDNNQVLYHDYVNIGLAVSVENGLIVPVIRDADIVGLKGIAEQSSALIEKARDGKLTAEDYHGGTFTVSSLGMFDIDDFVAIINPPEAGILAVGKIARRPVVATNNEGEEEITIKSICSLCLSYDHRIVDGAEAAKFLKRIKDYLEEPVLLI